MSYHRCTQPFAAAYGGRTVMVAPGDVFADDHPLYVGREQFFEPVEETVARSERRDIIEQATAAPGEKRSTRKPRDDD